MNFLLLRAALGSLRAYGLLSITAILGVAIGVATVLATASVVEGARQDVLRRMDTLGARLLVITPVSRSTSDIRQSSPSVESLTDVDLSLLMHQLSGIDTAAAYAAKRLQVTVAGRGWRTLVVGATESYLAARDWSLAQGRPILPDDDRQTARVAVIGQRIADELFAGADPLGHLIRIEESPFTVVGVLERKGDDPAGRDQDDVVFVPLRTARVHFLGRQSGSVDHIDALILKIADENASDTVRLEASSLLESRHPFSASGDSDFRIFNPIQVAMQKSQSGQSFAWLLSAVTACALLAGSAGVMNTMLAAVHHRRREISIRLAIGARPKDILYQFMFEAALLCVVGSAIGLIGGLVTAVQLNDFLDWPIFFDSHVLTLSVAASSITAIAGGIAPALKAARLDPSEVFRST
jgi:putative ABC transport system permease protein